MKRKMMLFCLLSFVVISALRAARPQISSGENEYWYYMKFVNGAYVIEAHADREVCTAEFPAGGKAQLWKVQGSAAAGYTFTNQLGQQLYAAGTTSGSEIRATTGYTTGTRFRMTNNGENAVICPFSNAGQAFNCWNGMGLGNAIRLYSSSDGNAPITFLTEEEINTVGTEVNVIPYPLNIEKHDGEGLDIKTLSLISYDNDAAQTVAQQLAEELTQTAGISIAAEKHESVPTEGVVLSFATDATLGSEAYTLSVSATGIKITASGFAGFFYAMQTLRQLMPRAIYSGILQTDIDWHVEFVDIEDEPRFAHRGFHLDVSRHFFSIDEVKKLLDVAAIYKLNLFHFHLTDDQGWRIEIPEYPRLTTVGAVRKQSLTINDPTNGTEFYDDTEYGRGCFYTLDELRDIVAYAKERNIEIMPEVDMPGHMVAAIASYPELSCDPTKEYEVRVKKGISSDVLNVGKDEVIDFLKCVLGHVAEVFPYKLMHIGGDECPTTAWQGNEDCARRISEEGLSGVEELQPWLVEKLGCYLRDNYGKQVVVWDELLAHWKDEYTIEPIIMAWRGTGYISSAADKGFKSIAVSTSPLYFDLLQISPDKMEIDAPYFGGYGDNSINSIDKVYAYNPTASVSGREEYVLGTQANLWTESLTSPEEAEYQYFPRLLALSETAWLPTAKKDFGGFYNRLQTHADILDAKDITYAPHYFRQPDLTAAETALLEAASILGQAEPGEVGHAEVAAYNALQDAYDALLSDEDNTEKLNALNTQIELYKEAPIVLPKEGEYYRILSASTYFRNRYNGSALYDKGDELGFHYTEQTEPEELWQFVPGEGGTYRLVSSLSNGQLKLQEQAGAKASLIKIGSDIIIRKATKPAGGYTFIPGVVNIKTGNYNLYAEISGDLSSSADSTLCYPGTWRIERVENFLQRLQGLVNKAQLIIETSKSGEDGQPSVESLSYLSDEIITPAKALVATGIVSKEDYLIYAERYLQFLEMNQVSIYDTLDENYYYYIRNAYFTAYFACADENSFDVVPLTYGKTDGYKWRFVKTEDGVYIKNKLTGKGAYVAANAQDEKVKTGSNYEWRLKSISTDEGKQGTGILDATGAYSWYANPNAWDYVLLKPYNWGASIWEFVITTDEVPTAINDVSTETSTDKAIYDLQGRPARQPQSGIYIQGGKKLIIN